MARLRNVLGAAALVAALGLSAQAFAQGGVPTGNPSGMDPTTAAPSEKQLLDALQGGRLEGRVSIPDQRSRVLEQPAGRDYQAFREGWLPWIGGIVVLGALAALALFYFVRGRIELAPDRPSGRLILRFGWFERVNHWMTATAFILLAITGLNYIFGKRLLTPLIGEDAFAAWSQWAKYIHNFVSWAFMLGLLFMIVMWIRGNLPDRTDGPWLRQLGGFFNNSHPPARRFNAGQKLIFWAVVLGGLALSVTGLILLFPFTVAGIEGMQIAQYLHAVVGVLLIGAILGHIYIGTIGMEGAFDAMGTGEVDLTWARKHHSLWVEEEQAKTARGPQLGRGAAPAE